MARLYGRSPRGQRLIGRVPYGHWQTTTFIAGLRHDSIVAPMTLDGPMNGQAFCAYVAKFLAPTLRPGDLVIADNLSSHKAAEARATIEARGAAFLFVPPYSPDQNPIEQMIAKLKALIRKVAPRTREALDRCIADSLKAFTSQECANYLANSGYAQSA